MATGGSKCEFCESPSEDVWNCEECKLKLCDKCNHKMHIKITANIDHKVCKMNENDNDGENETQHFELSKFPCTKHADSACFAICDHCSKCLCKECLKKPTQEICNERLEKIKEHKEQIDEALPFFTEHLESLNELEEKYEAKYNEIKDQILTRKEKIKSLATEEAIKLEKDLNSMWNPTKEALKQEKTRLTNAEKDLTDRKKIAEEAINSQDGGRIIAAADRVVKEMPLKKWQPITEPPKILFSTNVSTSSIALGSIIPLPKLKVTKTLKCDATDLLSIVDDEVAIGYERKTKQIKQFVFTEKGLYITKVFKKPKNGSFNCRSMTSMKDSLLLTMQDNGDAYQLSFRGKNFSSMSSQLSVGNEKIVPICTNKKEDIFIGYQYKEEPLPFGGFRDWFKHSKGIAIFKIENFSYKLIHKFDINMINGKFFKHPKAIATNTNEDICIIDELNNTTGEGRLIVVNKVAQFRWEFTGQGQDLQQFFPEQAATGQAEVQEQVPTGQDDNPKQFFPEQVATSSKGYIFVSDKKNNTVYMLSMNGDLLARIGESDGIEQPSGLAVNQDDQLLVGCPGKLHIVEIQDE